MLNYCLDARTVNEHFPGIGRYTINLARAMVPLLADDEKLLLLRDSTQPSPWNLDEAAGTHGHTRIVDVPVSPFALSQQWKVPQHLHRLNVDVYHSPYYLMPYFPQVPALVTVHDIIPLLYPRYFPLTQRFIFSITLGLALRRSTRVIAVSQATKQDLGRYLGISHSNIRVILEAADPAFQEIPAVERKQTRTKLGLPEQYVLYFGSNKPHKNLPTLVRAWAKVQPQPMPLIIAGVWDRRYPDAKEEADAYNLSNAIRFLGLVEEDDVPALYTGATTFVFPSEYEGFGLPVLEAMASGTPVACSNRACLPEIAGDAALLFDPSDVDGIAKALRTLLANAGLRDELRGRGLDRAGAFSWQRAARETLTLYREIALS